jgi:hypothetical protein
MSKSAEEVIAEVFSRCEADEGLPDEIAVALRTASQSGEWEADLIERSLLRLHASK